MGFRVQLVAVSGKSPGAIHEAFGVKPTQEFVDVPEQAVLGATLPSGAYLLYLNDGVALGDDALADLSEGASLVVCRANETVMESCVERWTDGRQRWSVLHDAQQGIEHLETTGNLPAQYEPIRARLFAQQAEDDGADFVFDVPVELFVALGGIRYDQDLPDDRDGDGPWQVLTRVELPKSWWRRLLG